MQMRLHRKLKRLFFKQMQAELFSIGRAVLRRRRDYFGQRRSFALPTLK